MQNEQGPKSPPKIQDESLTTPHPPVKVEAGPEENGVVVDLNNLQSTGDPDAGNIPAKVQDMDWNNGKPEVTPDDVEKLPAHKNPEAENEALLRENKGEKPGDDSFEASEEVNTGQSGG